jgi:hypothetical protein
MKNNPSAPSQVSAIAPGAALTPQQALDAGVADQAQQQMSINGANSNAQSPNSRAASQPKATVNKNSSKPTRATTPNSMRQQNPALLSNRRTTPLPRTTAAADRCLVPTALSKPLFYSTRFGGCGCPISHRAFFCPQGKCCGAANRNRPTGFSGGVRRQLEWCVRTVVNSGKQHVYTAPNSLHKERNMNTSITTSDVICSDKVEGTAVYNNAGEKLGSIDSLMIDKRTGQVRHAVLEFGGFLGLGTDRFPLPWAMLNYDTDRDGYVVPIDKDRLDDAPRYPHTGASPFTTDAGYGQRVNNFYGY